MQYPDNSAYLVVVRLPWRITVLNEKQAAIELGLAVATLRNWRCREVGPAFHKLGRSVRYDRLEIERYKRESRHEPSSALAAKETHRGIA